MNKLTVRLRQHWPFLVFIPLLAIVMTWPTVIKVFDTETIWLPSDDPDVGMKLWDARYVGELLAGEADFYFTDLLFYPQGLSLDFHNFSVPHMLAMRAIQSFLPASNAFILCFLLSILANSAACYLFLNYLFRDRLLSLFGCLIFGLNVFVIDYAHLPDVNLIAAIPLVIYCVHRGLDEGRTRWMVVAGLLSAITAFTGMYIYACLVITLGIYTLSRLPKKWRDRRFWTCIIVLLAVAGPLSSLRVYPMIRDSARLDAALAKTGGTEAYNDLLSFLVNPASPLTKLLFDGVLDKPIPDVPENGYLGYVAWLLATIGLVKAQNRRRILPWLALLLAFVWLRLGSTLLVNGQPLEQIRLPKYYLDQLLPAVFEAFGVTAYFQIGVLLPLAVLATYGLKTLLNAFATERRRRIVFTCLALIMLETYAPLDSEIIPAQRLRYIDWLNTEPTPEEIRLINLPFGRQASKRNALLHSYSGFPHAEGLAARTPSAAYTYIQNNLLLSSWNNHRYIYCFPTSATMVRNSLDQLLDDGFTHIVVHHPSIFKKSLSAMFPHILPAYEDGYVRIYRVAEMSDSCQHTAFLSDDVFAELYSALPPAIVRLNDSAVVLSIHPAAEAEGDMAMFYTRILDTSREILPLTVDDLVDSRAPSSEQDSAAVRMLSDSQFVWLVYDPQTTAPKLLHTYTEWISSRFESCGQGAGTDSVALEYFKRGDIPCDLLIDDTPVQVVYQNGMNLANALLQFDGEQLSLHLVWAQLARELHSVSLQVFDEFGTRVIGADRTIPHEPAIDLRLDLSTLEPGEYAANLIVYNYETREDVPGKIAASDTPFKRELELGRVAIK